MKSKSSLLIRVMAIVAPLLGLMFSACAPDQPLPESKHRQFVVGVSPFLDGESEDEVFRSLVGFLLEDMPLNSSLWLYDAYNIHTIAHVNIPNKRAFESSRTRANQFAKPIQSLKLFLGATNELPTVAELDFNHAVKFPQFMDFVGEEFVVTDADTSVLILGSPLYQDAKEPGFSMRGDYFPSDGHLAATREHSVYGRAGHSNRLETINVHYGYFGDPWKSDLHREKIIRFWTLFLAGQGGTLSTLTGDLPTIFNTLGDPNTEAVRSPAQQELAKVVPGKIEMLRVTRDVPITDWITGELPSNHRPPPPTSTRGPMKIGIRWTGDLDIDLYAKAAEYSEYLFFDRTEVAEGYYFKDHRSSPEREFEFVEFTAPVNIDEVRASVNFYEGFSRGGVEGEVRVEFENRIYSGRFRLDASKGNQGRAGRGQNQFWQEIDIPSVLGL